MPGLPPSTDVMPLHEASPYTVMEVDATSSLCPPSAPSVDIHAGVYVCEVNNKISEDITELLYSVIV